MQWQAQGQIQSLIMRSGPQRVSVLMLRTQVCKHGTQHQHRGDIPEASLGVHHWNLASSNVLLACVLQHSFTLMWAQA